MYKVVGLGIGGDGLIYLMGRSHLFGDCLKYPHISQSRERWSGC